MAFVKAFIKEKEGSGRVDCVFNPTEYTITKSAVWRETVSQDAKNAPNKEFVGTKGRGLTMNLFFDAWMTQAGDISVPVEQLMKWTNPVEGRQPPSPPIIVFHWGRNSFFDAYLSSVSVQYLMFLPDGKPVRAQANVTLEEVPSDARRQNPTSGGPAGNTRAILAQGDSLHSIAFREYRDAALWRGLAAVNGIEDALRVRPGTSLLVPPLEDVAPLS